MCLRREGHEYFCQVAEEIQADISTDIGFRRTGSVNPWFSEDEEQNALELERALEDDGLPVRRLEPSEALEAVPSIAPELRGALFIENDYQVHNPKFVRGVAEVAVRLGAKLLLHQPVTRLLCDSNRVIGVETAAEKLYADKVILAAGVWSKALAATVGFHLPVEPVKGQMVLLGGPPGMVRHILNGEEIYVVPRPDGHILVGATQEDDAGFDKRVTAEGMRSLLEAALRLAPGLRELPVAGSWAGLRPYAARWGGPLLGPASDYENFIIATGHFRNGINLGPITGRLLKELLVDGETSLPLKPFHPDR